MGRRLRKPAPKNVGGVPLAPGQRVQGEQRRLTTAQLEALRKKGNTVVDMAREDPNYKLKAELMRDACEVYWPIIDELRNEDCTLEDPKEIYRRLYAHKDEFKDFATWQPSFAEKLCDPSPAGRQYIQRLINVTEEIESGRMTRAEGEHVMLSGGAVKRNDELVEGLKRLNLDVYNTIQTKYGGNMDKFVNENADAYEKRIAATKRKLALEGVQRMAKAGAAGASAAAASASSSSTTRNTG